MHVRPTPSIRRRLLGLTSGLLLAVVVVSAITAYREVHRAARLSASQRLTVVADRLEAMLETSVRQLRTQVGALANDAVVVAYRRATARGAVVSGDSVLAVMRGRTPGAVAHAELWDAAGRRVLATDEAMPVLATREAHALIALIDARDHAALGWFRSVHDSLFYPVIARVASDSDALGYLVQWRKITATAEGRRAFTDLIGSDARLYIGSDRNDIWTDLADRVPGPDLATADSSADVASIDAAGEAHLATIRSLGGSPWTLVVSFPETAVFAPSRATLQHLAGYALLVLILGCIGAYVLSVRMTDPLRELMDAVTAVGAGDYSRRVTIRRADEIGHLGQVFNTMSERVADAQRELADRAHDLEQQTTELEITNEQLQQQAVELEVGNAQLQEQTIEMEAVIEQLQGTETELEERTMAAEASERRVRTVLESIQEAFFALDADWRFTYLNPQAEKLLRLGASKLLGRSIWEVFPHLGASQFDIQYRRVAEDGRPVTFVEYVPRLGAWLENNVYPAPEGGIAVYLGDVSERVSREEAIAESERRYRLMFNGNPLPMWVVDAQSLTFLAVNDAAVEHYGWSREEFLAMTIHDIRPAEIRGEPLIAGAWRAGRVPEPGIRQHLTRDGRVLSVELTFYGLEWDGRPSRLALINDLTPRLAAEAALRESETQLRQAQKMEAVGQLAGGVAHDFNNLLTVITSYSGMLIRETAEEDPAHADLVAIRDAADRAATLTRQLLAFSRQQLLQPQVLDLNDVARDMEKLLRRVLRENIRLETRLAPTLDFVHADPGQIEQVIMNLVVNARDAMPEGGRILLETAEEQVDERSAAMHTDATPGDYIVLSVIDGGTGMDASTMEHMFEPFFTTKGLGKGTGLGLATAYGIVRQTGGFITCQSEVGVGTTFRLYFPRCEDERVSSMSAPQPVPAPGGSETILLVEDEEPVRTVAGRILRESGYTVLEASDGHEALSVWDAQRDLIDLIVTDMVMPNMGGRELASLVRLRRPNVRLLFLSGYAEDAVHHADFLEPGNLFLDKPFSEEKLASKVREALDQS